MKDKIFTFVAYSSPFVCFALLAIKMAMLLKEAHH